MENTNTFSHSSFLHSNTARRNLRRSFSIAKDFLNCCNYCRKQLGNGYDIYMYKGDTPFCSEECRKEQIEIDDAMEKDYVQNAKKTMKFRMKDVNNTSEAEGIQQASVVPSAVAASHDYFLFGV